jgi:hypothetical protein
LTDRYDRAIANLTQYMEIVSDQNPNASSWAVLNLWRAGVKRAWACPHIWVGGPLFAYVSYDPSDPGAPDGSVCGCLTQVRTGDVGTPFNDLTEDIRLDERLPHVPEDITLESLPVFADWQRVVDVRMPDRDWAEFDQRAERGELNDVLNPEDLTRRYPL